MQWKEMLPVCDVYACVFCVAVSPVFTSLQAMLASAELSVSAGDSVRLRCDAVGRPRVEVQWFKDDKMLSASGPASTSSSSSSSPDYYYYDYPYTGGDTSFSSRRVRHPYSRRHRSRRRRRSGGQGDGVTAPSWSRSPADLQLDNTDELYVDDDDGRLSLTLESVTSDDAGLYTCRAFNKAGAVNFTYTVHVTGMTSYKWRLPALVHFSSKYIVMCSVWTAAVISVRMSSPLLYGVS